MIDWIKNKFKKTEETPLKKGETLFDQYQLIKQDIDNIEKNYDTIVKRSLEKDFENFKLQTHNYSKKTEHWAISESSYSEITLTKFKEDKYLELKIEYHLMYDKLKINRVSLRPMYITLDEKYLYDIISDYIMFVKIKEIKDQYKRVNEQSDLIDDVLDSKKIKRSIKLNKIFNEI